MIYRVPDLLEYKFNAEKNLINILLTFSMRVFSGYPPVVGECVVLVIYNTKLWNLIQLNSWIYLITKQ